MKLRQREPRQRDIRRLEWLRTQPCVVCGCGWPQSEAAHIRVGSINHDKRETGMAEKASDKWTISLCNRCHREQHAAGDELKWWASKGMDPFMTAIRQQPEPAKVCPRCNGEGWLEPIGPKSDGSYITSRPCPRCHGDGS